MLGNGEEQQRLLANQGGSNGSNMLISQDCMDSGKENNKQDEDSKFYQRYTSLAFDNKLKSILIETESFGLTNAEVGIMKDFKKTSKENMLSTKF